MCVMSTLNLMFQMSFLLLNIFFFLKRLSNCNFFNLTILTFLITAWYKLAVLTLFLRIASLHLTIMTFLTHDYVFISRNSDFQSQNCEIKCYNNFFFPVAETASIWMTSGTFNLNKLWRLEWHLFFLTKVPHSNFLICSNYRCQKYEHFN